MMTNCHSDEIRNNKPKRGRPKKKPSRNGKNWTAEETSFLIENWGCKGGIPYIAKTLGRSVNAIKIRAQRIKLGPYIDGGICVSYNLLRNIIRGRERRSDAGSYDYTLMMWEREGLKIKSVRVQNSVFRVVDIEQFWKWARKHQELFDFSRFQEGALGKEPSWVKEKRRVDRENARFGFECKHKWSFHEESTLRFMCECGTTWTELERQFNRTSSAIRRKIYDLGLPHPTSCRGFGKGKRWNEEELRTLVRLINQGYCHEYCADKLQRTAQSIRGKIEFLNRRGLWSRYE